MNMDLCIQGAGPYSASIKTVEEDLQKLQKKIDSLKGSLIWINNLLILTSY